MMKEPLLLPEHSIPVNSFDFISQYLKDNPINETPKKWEQIGDTGVYGYWDKVDGHDIFIVDYPTRF